FGALAPAHATLLGELARAAGPGVALSFVTPWYNGLFLGASRERAEAYLAELGGAAPAGVPTVWTGPAVRSLFVDRPGVTAYKHLVGADRPALYWDNTLYARAHRDYWLRSPDRAHRAGWLEPCDVDFYEGAERDFAGMYVNGHAGELYRIKYMTAADFLWNPEAYLPERSLARALVALYGREFAERLLSWDEHYWATRERVNRFRAGMDSEPPTRDAEALAAELAEMRAHPDAEPRLLDELAEKLGELSEDDPT
ncbi:MAG: beta-N-acetylglucosaminidase domain-containing protein, partial [Candidatus Methylomirabilis sp.]|nr:beta-N-acetylglucosaminidase domain-containing protein [Deltaproteobacteria bacterium]